MTFQTYQQEFTNIAGANPSLEVLLEQGHAFAHEAGVFIAEREELYITSNRLINSDGEQYVEISRIKLSSSATREVVNLADIKMGNGGVKYKHGILFCAQGGMNDPSGLFYLDLKEPNKATLLVSAFHGRPFNSLNDVVINSDGSIWFTDPSYGFEQGYRPAARLPNQVYRFDPETEDLRVVADGFGHPNGICFSPDEKIVYITDTDWINGTGVTDDTKSSSM